MASNVALVQQAYQETPTAFSSDIAERTGLTVKQVRSARSALVSSGRLPRMFGFGGALYQSSPQIQQDYRDIFAGYKIIAVE